MANEKKTRRARRTRYRLRLVGGGRPRLCVHRSHKNISAQIIDDALGRTLASASTLEPDFRASDEAAGSKTMAARAIGRLVAERARKAGVSKTVFDRGGCVYHGRVGALAEAARAGGLEF